MRTPVRLAEQIRLTGGYRSDMSTEAPHTDALGYKPPEAGLIVAVGAFGFLGCAVAAALWSERLDRKLWLPISAAITVIGGVVIAAGGDSRIVAFIGAIIVFFGFNLWVPMTYARSAENFPTRARTTGFAIVDGVGHLGGGIGVLVIAPAHPGHEHARSAHARQRVPRRRGADRDVRRRDAQQALRGHLALIGSPAARVRTSVHPARDRVDCHIRQVDGNA
jgi:Major Facilitator Superfamily